MRLSCETATLSFFRSSLSSLLNARWIKGLCLTDEGHDKVDVSPFLNALLVDGSTVETLELFEWTVSGANASVCRALALREVDLRDCEGNGGALFLFGGNFQDPTLRYRTVINGEIDHAKQYLRILLNERKTLKRLPVDNDVDIMPTVFDLLRTDHNLDALFLPQASASSAFPEALTKAKGPREVEFITQLQPHAELIREMLKGNNGIEEIWARDFDPKRLTLPRPNQTDMDYQYVITYDTARNRCNRLLRETESPVEKLAIIGQQHRVIIEPDDLWATSLNKRVDLDVTYDLLRTIDGGPGQFLKDAVEEASSAGLETGIARNRA